ncbi:helix-turn-helix domain-containing protein [Mucilaginibacter sp. AW1-3]
MYPEIAENIIPTYTLNQGGTGSSLFDMVEAKGKFRQQKANFLTPHRKDYYLLVMVKQGNSRHWVDIKPYTLQPDTFYFSTPAQIHLKEQTEPLIGTLLCFTDEFLNLEDNHSLKALPIIQNPHNGHELKLTPPDVLFIEDILQKMLTEHRQKNGWKGGMLQAYLRVLLIYLSRLYAGQFEHRETSAERQLLDKYCKLIEEEHCRLHDVAAYAGLLHITPGHLNEVIKQQSGKTAIIHIHERLMLEAKRLLFHTEQSVKEIAFGLGFEDAAYFNRFFKRLSRQTPLAYRTQIREMYH